jgi:hypothetical protein
MSYKKREDIPRAKRTLWSPERGGRTWQRVADKKVQKFSFSPYTAKAHTDYSFYADIEMEQEIESPPGSGKKTKFFTMPVATDTFLGFREQIENGEFAERAGLIVEHMGGGRVKSVEYWRSRERGRRFSKQTA